MIERLGQEISEGKTKIIYEIPGTNEVLIQNKDDITADGEKKDIMTSKAVLATETTSNCFELLKLAGIPNHFIRRESGDTFRAQRVDMIPIECVARRIAYGSYLKRAPWMEKGYRFVSPVVEFFDKDDNMHDPLLDWDQDTDIITRYDANKLISEESIIDTLSGEQAFRLSVNRWYDITKLATNVFEVLETAWAKQDVTLVDIKIECGLNTEGQLVVADVIDNDSWRILPGVDPDKMFDKQFYRDGQSVSYVADRYAWVAQATGKFLTSKF